MNVPVPHSFYCGIDIGSTTVKIALVDPLTKALLYSDYFRHGARQAETARIMLEKAQAFAGKNSTFNVAVCGSGGSIIAGAIGAHFIQEVVANSLAIREKYPKTRVAIELGGQDAKVIFFHKDPATGKLIASDMRMNGSCAGGTGAFIDEMAILLKTDISEFNALAAKGKTVYPISGRCGVFAKTDIQPLLSQGVSREDLALSTFHAIAKQTIGGLAQGMEIIPPVIFEGGPLTFNPELIQVFIERLGLKEEDMVIPEHPEIIVAYGAALSIDAMFNNEPGNYNHADALKALSQPQSDYAVSNVYESLPLFETDKARQKFFQRHKVPERKNHVHGDVLEVYLGIDAGSTTSKFVFLNRDGEVVDSFYNSNSGDPMHILQKGLLKLNEQYKKKGVKIRILGVGTTGYGERLFAAGFKADFHTVETVAHAQAALHFFPRASFILDIGGQDMKAITLSDGIVTGITLNEACSAGCGSFLEMYSRSLNIPVTEIAEKAFASKTPARLGSRCTIFMNSSIITEQKNGKTSEDIMAGLCKSIIENVFTKVIRIFNLDFMGEMVVVQGGTFKNDAVLRAFEQYSSKKVVRAPWPGEMGAIGIALLTKKHMEESAVDNKIPESSFIGFDKLASFDFTKTTGYFCKFCSNNCNRTLITFNDGSSFIIGNRCERGEILGDIKDPTVKEQLKKTREKQISVPDMIYRRKELLFADTNPPIVSPQKEMTIGIPRVLEFWNSYPFWNALFTSLGFKIVLSSESTVKRYEEGLQYVPSDTACFPAKVSHGHIMELINRKVDRIFMPMMLRMKPENPQTPSFFLCSVVQGYPLILKESHEPLKKNGIPMDNPYFHWYDDFSRDKQIAGYFANTFGLPEETIFTAIRIADEAQDNHTKTLQAEGSAILKSIEKSGEFAVVLAGRPYHNDLLVNHDLSRYFTRLGIPVLTIESLPGIEKIDLSAVRAETVTNFHVRMAAVAIFVSKHPNLELAQIVSFGCGHDAILSDEIIRLMKEGSGKDPLILKLDESDVQGPLNIRVKSFIETIRAKRRFGQVLKKLPFKLPDPFPIRFKKKDRKLKTILVPNLSRSFSILASAAVRRQGFKVECLPLAGTRAIELGKKYVHNDMCFPAQLNIGEGLEFLESCENPGDYALALGHTECDCRLAHYVSVARKALDDAGFSSVTVITTGEDRKGIHPGIKLGTRFQIRTLFGIIIGGLLDGMARRIRPYEIETGIVDGIHAHCINAVAKGLEKGIFRAVSAFARAVKAFNKIPLRNIFRKPRVFIVGEILLNYHPASNAYMESYLEKNGMEVVMPPMIDAFKKDTTTLRESHRRFYVRFPFAEVAQTLITDKLIDFVTGWMEKIYKKFEYYQAKDSYHDLAKNVEGFMDKIFNSGKGVLIPGDIIEYSRKGVNSFIILQPFGCLPNHITGRGMIKTLKKLLPYIQILSLDFDPDTSIANVENRLQMLIINAKELEKKEKAKAEAEEKKVLLKNKN